MLIQNRHPRKALLIALLMFLPKHPLSQPLLDSQVLSEQGTLLKSGPVELLSVGGQVAIADTTQDDINLQLGYLNTLAFFSKPMAVINSPIGEGLCSIVNGDVTVMGTVESANLNDYKLEFAQGKNAPSGFVFLSSGTTAVSGLLAPWPTAGLSGFYTLRLSAADTSGGSMASSVSVFIGQPSAVLTIESLDKPEGTSAGSDGKLYVADTHNNRIAVLTSTGGILSSLGGFHKPSGVAVDDVGNIYVADTQNDRVLKLAADGSIILTFGQSNKKKGPFHKPQDVAVDAARRVYVADTGNHSIKVFAEDGSPLLTFMLPDEGTPVSVTTDNSGRIYTADEKRSQVLQYDSSGLLLKSYGASLLKKPGGAAIDADGECLFVADSGNDRIVRFDRFGNLQASFAGFDKPAGLTLTTSGELLVTERKNDRLLKLALPDSTPPTVVGRHKGHGRAAANLTRFQGGKVERDDGTGVSVPPGALTADIEITVEQGDVVRDADIKEAKRRQRKTQAVSEEIEYGPAGTIFNTPVTLVLAYNPALVATRGLRESELKVYYWNPLLGDWEPMPSVVDTKTKTVSALTTHFSGYQVQGNGIGVAALIDEFHLREAYAFPNPVRGVSAVTIRIQPGLADSVEVRVYDLAGRKIHTSSNFRFSITSGENTYDHAWNVAGVASGVYSYVIRARRAGQADIVKAGKIGVIK